VGEVRRAIFGLDQLRRRRKRGLRVAKAPGLSQIGAGEPLAQRLDDRNGRADRRLEVEGGAMRLGEFGKRNAMAREQCLVRGHHRLACLQSCLDRALGWIALAAHQLDENVDLRVGRKRHRVARPA